MIINEVMKETGLTKKAIYYYEMEGLINPQKDPENNYRNYSGEDVRRLIIVNILRRLDLPIKEIAKILMNSVPLKDVLKEHLIAMNQKINLLVLNKMIINDLIIKDVKEEDFSFDTLKEFNLDMGKKTVSQGSVGKDLEQIFPGTLGKIFAIFYGSCLNVPLDTDEKIAAWSELIRRIDETDEIDFPEYIQKTVADLYKQAADIPMVREMPESYYIDQEELQKAKGYYQLQGFILDYLDLFGVVENYINMINSERGDGKTPAH